MIKRISFLFLFVSLHAAIANSPPAILFELGPLIDYQSHKAVWNAQAGFCFLVGSHACMGIKIAYRNEGAFDPSYPVFQMGFSYEVALLKDRTGPALNFVLAESKPGLDISVLGGWRWADLATSTTCFTGLGVRKFLLGSTYPTSILLGFRAGYIF